jgi:hypothetical protein
MLAVGDPQCALAQRAKVKGVIRHFACDEDGGLRPSGLASRRPTGSTDPAASRTRKRNSMPRLRQINPTGKSAKTCPVVLRKIFRLTRRANQRYQLARLTRQEGRLAIVTNVRWDAVDADVLLTNSTEAYGEVVWS